MHTNKEDKAMSAAFFKKATGLLISLGLTFGSGMGYADDTEIYFSSASDATAIRPNVLILIDTSVSMGTTVAGTGKSRLQIMKDAMTGVLNSMEDVNVGLARFTYSKGAAILYPVTYIEELVDDPSVSFVISSGSNDAEQNLSTGAVTLGDAVLDVRKDPSVTGSVVRSVAVSADDADEFNGDVAIDVPLFYMDPPGADTHDAARFNAINIPPGAIITSAFFELWSADAETGGSAVLSGEDVTSSTPFAASPFDISTRPKTAASVAWTGITNNGGVTPETSPDISSIINEIINLNPGWGAGNSLSIISHTTTAERLFASFDHATLPAPQLTINFDPVSLNDQMVALRFTNVNIPRNTTLTGATLNVTSTSTNATPGTTWQISAEDIGDSLALTTAAGSLNSRTKTAPVTVAGLDMPDMVANDTYPFTITSAIQSVINRGDWCGGNSLTVFIRQTAGSDIRNLQSFEGDEALAATLDIDFDPATTTGCRKVTETAQTSVSADDADQVAGSATTLTADLDLAEREVGLRFLGIDIPQASTILDATITFTANGSDSAGAPVVVIKGQAADNATTFTTATNNISSTVTRPRTAASVNWTTGTWPTNNEAKITPPLTAIVQEIVNRGGWASGNAMVFLFSDVGANTREAYSRDDPGNLSPRLSITYQASGTTAFSPNTTREAIIELIAALPNSDNTPIVESLYEVARYWRGEGMLGGDEREGKTADRISQIDSYTGGTVFYPGGCNTDDTNLSSASCATQAITGTPTYISPFDPDVSCQSNYQILLTDGEALFPVPSAVNPSPSGQYITAIQTLIPGSASCVSTGALTGTSISTTEKCAIDLVEFMNDVDQSTTAPDVQSVKTYTVGFELAALPEVVKYLKEIADVGSGEFFEATGATAEAQIIDAFSLFIGDVKNEPTSFAAPAVTTNTFNRLFSRDHIYLGLFTPDLQQRWDGNVKKYFVCIETDPDGDGVQDCELGKILDVDKDLAIDASTDLFLPASRSIWSAEDDGGETIVGGAGAELSDYTDRLIYTDTTLADTPLSPVSLGGSGYYFNDSNRLATPSLDAVRALVCPIPSTVVGSDCDIHMRWVLGKIVDPDDTTVPTGDGTDPTTRWIFNDVLHSSPRVITYGGDDIGTDNNSDGDVTDVLLGESTTLDGQVDTFFDKVIVGTNEGGLRMINGETGVEEWTFMPQLLLQNQRTLLINAEGTHFGGIDGTPTLRVVDRDRDGKIEPTATPSTSDSVQVFVGMRIGGNNIYALDLTPAATILNNTTPIVPKFMWRIPGGVAPFERLGQTWSPPKLARIAMNGAIKEVLIFAGGYDTALSNGFGTVPTAGFNNMGNAIYIVDQADGSKILSISGDDGDGNALNDADIIVPDMHYAIPAEVSLLDFNGDSIIDRLYVPDTGGQVWRVDIAADIDVDDPGSSVVGKLAAISNHATAPAVPADQRRFFQTPSVVQVRDTEFSDATGGEYDYVMLGSGYHDHPLNIDVHDRFYAFRDKNIGPMTGDSDHLAVGYPKSDGVAISHNVTNELIDVTNTVLNSTVAAHRASLGWFFDFNTFPPGTTVGEKVLSPAIAIQGKVLFTSYVPSSSALTNPCTANIGGSFTYNFNFLSTKAALDWDGVAGVDDLTDRRKSLGIGISSGIVPVFTKEGKIVGVTMSGGGFGDTVELSGKAFNRTFWYQDSQ